MFSYIMFFYKYDSLPLLVWDESRIANNALEMAFFKSGILPTYYGVVDHWNTKPPLLIWIIATFMKMGIEPLLSLRLPSILSAIATMVVAWGFCRYVLEDILAGTLSWLFLFTSQNFIGYHAAKTGDYDCLLSFLIFSYSILFWLAIEKCQEKINIKLILLSAFCFFLSVMTKGIAAFFPILGISIFVIVKKNRKFITLNSSVWAIYITAFFICLGYYFIRNMYDTGYLEAVWINELGGRFFEVNEGHNPSFWYYPKRLLMGFFPGIFGVFFSIISIKFFKNHTASAILFCLLCGCSILLIIMVAKTHLFWYTTPIIPFLSVAAALGTSSFIQLMKEKKQKLLGLFDHKRISAGLLSFLIVIGILTIYRNNVEIISEYQKTPYGYLWYGQFFNKVFHKDFSGRPTVYILDNGYKDTAGLQNYNPVLKFYIDLNSFKNKVQLIRELKSNFDSGDYILTCDYRCYGIFDNTYEVKKLFEDRWCKFGIIRPQIE